MGHINGSLESDRKQLWKVHTSTPLCRLSYEKKKTKKKTPKTAEPRMKLARLCPTPTKPSDRPWLSLSQYRNTSLQSLHDPHWFPF